MTAMPVRVRRFAAAVALTVALVPAAPARAGGAVAINTRDGFDVFRLAFEIRRAMQSVVEPTNAAVAFASCSECQTVALAIQVVLITGDPDVVSPTNLALAINYQCTLCETFASAYQFVLTTGGPARFTAEGNRTLAEIRRALQELRRGDLSLAEIHARLEESVTRLRSVLGSELVPAGRQSAETDEHPQPSGDAQPQQPEPSASPSPTASASPSPHPTPTPSPTES